MSQLKLTADGGGGTVAIKAPASTTGNAALEMTVPSTASGTLDSLNRAGNILQVVQTVKNDVFSSNSTSYADVTGMSAAITPSSTSNKVKVTVVLRCAMNQGDRWSSYILLRGSTVLFDGAADGSRTQCSAWHIPFQGTGTGNTFGDKTIVFLDSPSSTSALTYKLQVKVQSGATGYVNRSMNDTDADYGPRTSSSITLEEVAA